MRVDSDGKVRIFDSRIIGCGSSGPCHFEARYHSFNMAAESKPKPFSGVSYYCWIKCVLELWSDGCLISQFKLDSNPSPRREIIIWPTILYPPSTLKHWRRTPAHYFTHTGRIKSWISLVLNPTYSSIELTPPLYRTLDFLYPSFVLRLKRKLASGEGPNTLSLSEDD